METTALNKVNLSIEKGEFVAIMGPSGCGKSTLLNIIGLLDNPTDGKYFFNGEEVSKFKERQRTNLRKGNIGFVFQSFNLIDELTVYENVELPLLYLKVSPAERRRKVNDVLERMKISHRKKHFPQQLSGGQQQRVAISRAVVTKPMLILADEPTGNLDSANGEEVMNLLTELNNEGTTIVMVTHSPSDADKAHRIIQLFDGHIVTENIRQIFKDKDDESSESRDRFKTKISIVLTTTNRQMKELCIPVPYLKENEKAEVEVTLKGRKLKYDFRVESFSWEAEDEFSSLSDPVERSLARIYRLKKAIENYDKSWELIQIFNPSENTDHVHVLYRKKIK